MKIEMKKCKSRGFFLFAYLFSFFQATAQNDFTINKIIENEIHSFPALPVNNLTDTDRQKNNIIYACCKWSVDPAINFISGAVAFYFIPEENNFNTLILDLANPLHVDSVIYNNTQISFSHHDNQLDILFPINLPNGILDSVKIFYNGVPIPTGFGSFIQGYHSGTPIIYTLSEPFGSRDWWPCKQDLNDKIDSIDIYVTSPIQYRTASNGHLNSEDSTLSKRTCHWKSNYPIAAYLLAIGVTNYSVFSEQMILSNGDTLPLINYVYPENISDAQQSLHEIIEIIHLYDSLTIPYPFSKEKYGHAQFGWGGGMENQTMSFVGSFNSELIAHECAHQWFGDKITCGSWSDIWLNEGFATYFSGLVVEHLRPSEWQVWKRATLDGAVALPDGSVYCDDTISVSRIFNGRLSYRKASCLLHMLRWKLGDAVFFTAIKNYLNDPILAYGYARTSDLKYHLEQASGQNFTEFFTEWFYGSGFPSYTLEWENKGANIEIKISQVTSDLSVSFFHIPVPIKLKNEDHDTIVIANPTISGEVFTFNPGFIVEQVIFDPDLWIISKNNKVIDKSELLKDQIEIYPNPGKAIFTIKSKKPELFARDLKVFDQMGKEIFSIFYPDAIPKRKIDLSVLSSGVYFLRIETGGGVLVKRVVIEK